MAAASLGGRVKEGSQGLRLEVVELKRALGKCWRMPGRNGMGFSEELGGSEREGDPDEWRRGPLSRVKLSLGGSSRIKLDQVGPSRDPGLKIAGGSSSRDWFDIGLISSKLSL